MSKTTASVFVLALGVFFFSSDMRAENQIEWKGFINAGVGQSNQEFAKTHDNLSDSPNYSDISSFGMIATKQITDDWDAAIQLLARGFEGNNFAAEVEWGMVSWRPTSNLTFRAGKQKFPFWLISDQNQIGVLYPWARPPGEVYDMMPVTAFIGAGAEFVASGLLGGDFHFEVFGGGVGGNLPNNSFPLEIKSGGGHGATLSYRKGISLIRATYVKAFLKEAIYKAEAATTIAPGVTPTLDFPQSIKFGHTEVWSVGTAIDYMNVLLWYEFASRQTQSNLYKKRQGQYGTLGYYFWDRKILPHMTFAETVENDASGSLLGVSVITGNQQTTSYGLNYYFTPEVVLKGEYARSTVPQGKKDTFSAVPKGDVEVYTLMLSAVF